MVVIGGKWVPLTNFSPSSVPCISEEVRRGNVCIDKGKNVLSPAVNGCVMGDMERSNSFGDGTLPCLDLEVFMGWIPSHLALAPR